MAFANKKNPKAEMNTMSAPQAARAKPPGQAARAKPPGQAARANPPGSATPSRANFFLTPNKKSKTYSPVNRTTSSTTRKVKSFMKKYGQA